MVSIICKYPYWQIRNYLQVPVLANKKLFASTSCLVHYPRGRGNKTAYWKSCIGSWERLGAYIYIGRGTCAYPIRLKMVRSAKIKTIIYQKFIDLVDHSKYPALHWTIIGLNGTVGNGSVSLVSQSWYFISLTTVRTFSRPH